MNILGTGLSGLLGSRVVELLGESFQFKNLSLEEGFDITNPETLTRAFDESDAPWVFHFAAMTDVDGAEKERSEGTSGKTWKVNVEATQSIAALCEKHKKRLLYISTDYVFDGTKDKYKEDDAPNPQGWYAVTKYEGEKAVLKLNDGLVVRMANPYRALPSQFTGKKDFVHKIIDALNTGNELHAPSDQVMMPTLVDDVAQAIGTLVLGNASGIYHVAGSSVSTPFDIARSIATAYAIDGSKINKTSFAQYFAGRAPRPMRAVLTHDKINSLGISLHTFEEGLAIVKSQETV